MPKKIRNLIILILTIAAIFTAVRFAYALDVGLSYAERIGLGSSDPRIIIANIIRIVLGFLGIIALGLIIYAGWLWMTAEGNEEKIEKAKKILINAIIGLIIILAAFAFASYIISRICEATGGCGPVPPPVEVCDPPCGGSAPYCCNGSCQLTPCSPPPPPESFYISSTIPHNEDIDVVRNVTVKAFFNKQIDNSVTIPTINNNFKLEKIATINPATGAPTPITPAVIVAGSATTTVEKKEIDYKADAACGNELNTPNCFDSWSKFKVTINSASGIVAIGNQSLSCAGVSNTCQFVFSTNDLIDTGPPKAGIVPTQMCKDDGYLKSDANTVGAWANDDIGISSISFFQKRQGQNQAMVHTTVGNNQRYQYAQWKYDTSSMNIGDSYEFKIEAADMANSLATSSFNTTIKPGHCCNGKKDLDEEDVDCGGADCLSCWGGPCNLNEPNQCTLNNNPNCSDNLCITWFCDCRSDDCLCEQKPAIYWVTPIGGFCRTANGQPTNTACLDDSLCGSGKCDKGTANGAVGNFVTIGGRNFGNTPGQVYFSKGDGSWEEAKLANDPATGNSQCSSEVWKNNQIIAILPPGLTAISSSTIRVRAVSNYEDTTFDDYGPRIDFLVNTISRPGLCKLEPSHGKQNEIINYYGIKLNSSQAYFGDISNMTAGLNSSFTSDKQGTASVPNIIAGETTSFVLLNVISSNYLNFLKDFEAAEAPYITSFDPTSGTTGQYVTIFGSGFGNTRGTSKVYFGDIVNGKEASYNFPAVCADSVWSNNQVIVKVPDNITNGDYKLTMKIANWPPIDTTNLTPSQFTVNTSLPLKPSLCKISPIMGLNNSEVSLWGEYFGVKDNNSKVRFHLNHDQFGNNISFWQEDANSSAPKPYKVITTVHNQAVSGPVRAVKSSPELAGNGLNFKVGSCTKNEDCKIGESSDVCCPANSYKAGRCQPDLNLCNVEIPSCVYEWDFNTGSGISCDGNLYQSGCQASDDICQRSGMLYCDPASCTCKPGKPCDSNVLSPGCQASDDICQPDFDYCDPSDCYCKNINSSCSGYSLNQCQNNYLCPNLPGQCGVGTLPPLSCDCQKLFGQNLEYNSGLNRCANNTINCSIDEDGNIIIGTKTISLGTVNAVCNRVGSNYYWQMDPRSLTPPSGSCPNQDWILDSNSWCTLATTTASGLTKESCHVCANNLTCINYGNSSDNIGACVVDYPVCPANSSCDTNKICTNSANSVCECCCRIRQGNQDCCVPLECEGNCGSDATSTDTDTYGYCTGCSTVGTTQAEHDAACNCSGHSGQYCDAEAAGGKGVCRDCAGLSSVLCSYHETACCVDGKNNNICRGGVGNKNLVGKTNDNPDLAYCSYYNCTTSRPVTCNNTASVTGEFYNLTSCNEQCKDFNSPTGDRCISSATPITCDNSLCSFSCIQSDGDYCGVGACTYSSTDPDSCGNCCCDPSNQGTTPGLANYDKCRDLDQAKLNCRPNKSPCTGDERGLCCGCSKDSDCVLPNQSPDVVGCSNDTCCRSRPNVTEMVPAPEAENICRNALISATFDKPMNVSSFQGNVIVVGDYEFEQCPQGTRYLSSDNKKENKRNIFVKYYYRTKERIEKIFNKIFANNVLADEPQENHNYCAVTGIVGGYNTNYEGVMTFSLTNRALDPNRLFFVIIKGKSDLYATSTDGVLSTWGVGLKGNQSYKFNAQQFNNSEIWSFRTGQDLCQIGSVNIDPSSYLFQKAGQEQTFQAMASSTVGQAIVSIAGVYSWQWDWTIDNQDVVKFRNGNPLADSNMQTLVAQNVDDGKTILNAKATIKEDTVFTPSTVGQGRTGKANIYVFLCENPWPSIRADGNWYPWTDTQSNCSPGLEGSGCLNTNFELYYCRDAGGAGTADDLPAILSDDTVIRGQTTMPEVLKEVYFFRQTVPGQTNLIVNDSRTGGRVSASWTAVSGAAGYKLYYGITSRSYSKFLDIRGNTTAEVANLTNDQTYYFAVTAYFTAGAESSYSNEVIVVPTDRTPPLSVIGLSAATSTNSVTLSWTPNNTDTASYEVAYGTFPGIYGTSIEIDKTNNCTTQCSYEVKDLSGNNTYYFAVYALDAYKNKSAPATIQAILP